MMRWLFLTITLMLPVAAQAQLPVPTQNLNPSQAPMRIQMPDAAPAATTTSNMPPDFYPRPPCTKPDKGALKSPGNDADAMRVYNLRVRNFNKSAVAFNACIKVYIDNAQNDINAIQAIVHAAVADANTH